MKSQRGAMEMSMGTIVTIVLMITVLVLALVFINQIFRSGEDSVTEIDRAVKNEIQKLFSSDQSKRIIIYPNSRLITLKKGATEPSGFAFSIRNIENTAGSFTYTIKVADSGIRANCGVSASEALEFLESPAQGGPITIPSGNVMDEPELIRYRLPENAPVCLIRYALEVKKDGQPYGSSISIDVDIRPE